MTPSGPREETLIIGVYVDDLFMLFSHKDKHSIYHTFTERLALDWNKVEDEGPIAPTC